MRSQSAMFVPHFTERKHVQAWLIVTEPRPACSLNQAATVRYFLLFFVGAFCAANDARR